MRKSPSQRSKEARERNKCSTCERRSNHKIGCFAFTEEPLSCWAHTTHEDWLTKVNAEIKEYNGGKGKGV